MGTSKWRNIYFHQDVRKVALSIFSHKTSFTIQMVQLSEAMRPEDDSCMGKVKECFSTRAVQI